MTLATLTASRVDTKIDAFCSPQGPEIFRPVAYPSEVCCPDPLDVAAIHTEARDLFDVLLYRVTDPDAGSKVGKIMLLRGDSGSGKTHLMRAFRTRAHQLGLAYFGYMQMTSLSGNYSRYILRKLIDSLDTPYYNAADTPSPTTGLQRISKAVAESPHLNQTAIRRIQTEGLEFDECAALVVDLAEQAVCDTRLTHVPIDLLIAMLYLQSDHPALHSRVMKYLRAEALSELDRTRLAGISPLDGDESVQAMIERLGHLMWSTQGAALILCVDQLEDLMVQDSAAERFPRAINGLIKVAENVPSSLIIISCLDDYYDSLRSRLDSSAIDRIEKDPAPMRLSGRRSRDEINELVSTHLGYLFDHFNIAPDQSPVTYPIPNVLLERSIQQSTRSVLSTCKAYREQCIMSGLLVSPQPVAAPTDEPRSNEQQRRRAEAPVSFDQDWNDFQAAIEQSLPDDEETLAELLASSIEHCVEEINATRFVESVHCGSAVEVNIQTNQHAPHKSSFVAGVCNRSPGGGALGKQIESVFQQVDACKSVRVPVIVRSTEYTPKTPSSKIAKLFASLFARGGRFVVVPDSCWRAMSAMKRFREARSSDPGFQEWLQEARPLIHLKPLREILALDELSDQLDTSTETSSPAAADNPTRQASAVQAKTDREADQPSADRTELSNQSSNTERREDPPVETETADVAEHSPMSPQPGNVLIGHTCNRCRQEVQLSWKALTRHAVFLGGTGSGKTTAALNLIEQLLDQGIPALLIDRKGDLVTYARESSWLSDTADPETAQRRRRLRQRVDIAVYTPGHTGGRPIKLPIAPDRMREMNSADRQLTVRQAAHSLGQMLGYRTMAGKGAKHVSVMVKAIELMTELGYQSITLKDMIDYINERDDALVAAIGVLDVKLFDSLLQDLQMLLINRQLLFPSEGESLSAEQFFGLGEYGQPGRTRMSVISTKFLGGTASIQFWVAQLLLELSRWASKSPSKELQAVVFFDEADLYLPATTKPASKEPMEGLLKRARSAGLGVLLATQSPGDLDYKSKENINTWLVGKIKETTAIKKMKPMLSGLNRDVSASLSSQETGQFYFVSGLDCTATSIRSQRSLIDTEQIAEDEILRMAHGSMCDR